MTLSLYSDEYFMGEALKQAQMAFEANEVPIGAVIVCKNKIIAKAHNQTEKLNDPTAHAEILAITTACEYLGSKYLTDCTLYVTLEPCSMCAGAIFWSQLEKIVYGASDEKRGYTAFNTNIILPKTTIINGIKAEECSALVKDFFKKLR